MKSQLIVLYVSNMINLLIDILETVKRRITFIIIIFFFWNASMKLLGISDASNLNKKNFKNACSPWISTKNAYWFLIFFFHWDNVAESRWANVKLATNEFLNREAIYFGRFDVILSC